MHASAQLYSSGSKLSKIAIVGGLHVAFVVAMMGIGIHQADRPAEPPPLVLATDLPIIVPNIKIDPPVMPATSLPTITPPIIPVVEVATSTRVEPVITVTQGVPVEQPAVPATGAVVASAATVEQPRKARTYMAALANADACALPSYPAASARNGDTGTVTLALLIGPDGKVGASRVQRSSGFPELDRAAIAALKMCTFKPASTNGVPESAWGQIAYVWTLD